ADGVAVAEGEPGNRVRHRVRHRSLERIFFATDYADYADQRESSQLISALIRAIRGKKMLSVPQRRHFTPQAVPSSSAVPPCGWPGRGARARDRCARTPRPASPAAAAG